MESKTLFYTAVLRHPPARHIFVKQNLDSLLIFGYAGKEIHLSKLPLTNGVITKSQNYFDGETFQNDNIIASIFSLDDKFYGMDKHGTLFMLSNDTGHDGNAEYDLFEDSPDKSEKLSISNKRSVVTDSMILSLCLADEGHLALLTSSESKIFVEIINIHDGCHIKKYLIQSSGFVGLSSKEVNLIEWIPRNKVIDEFYTSWFKEDREKTGFFVIVFNEGSIFVLFPESGELEYLFLSPSPCIALYWDYYPNPDCEAAGSCSLTLVTAAGGVLKLTEVGETVTKYLPVGNLKSVFRDPSQNLYFSDYKNSYRLSLSSSVPECSLLPLKGILCWGGWEGNCTLALSRSGEIYAINNLCKISELQGVSQILPNSSLTARIRQQTTLLDKVNSQIIEVDDYIKAVALSNKDMKFSLNAQSISVRKLQYTFSLNMLCLTEGILIKKDDWLLSFCLRADNGVPISLLHKLRQSIKSSLSHTQVFVCTLKKHPQSDLTIEVSLVFKRCPSYITHYPTISIGKVEMDPSHFLYSGVELDYCYIPSEQDSFNIKSIIEEFFYVAKEDESSSRERNLEPEETKLSISLSNLFPKDSVFKCFLKNSEALWRTSQWSKACEGKKLEIAIGDKLATVELSNDGNTLTISGTDMSSCFSLKLALFLSAPGGCSLRIDRKLALNLLEIYSTRSELYAHLDHPPKENVQELIRQWNENLMSYFTP